MGSHNDVVAAEGAEGVRLEVAVLVGRGLADAVTVECGGKEA